MPGYANPQNLNRFSYVTNNPLRYTDPTGHKECDEVDAYGNCYSYDDVDIPDPFDPPDPPDDNGGGGQSLPIPYLNTDYYQLMTNGLYSGPVPQLAYCGWIDCTLSAISILASVFTLHPVTAGPALIVDAIVTVAAIVRTEIDYSQGEISNTRRWTLNGTGVLGFIPEHWGVAFSFINGLVTFSGAPP